MFFHFYSACHCTIFVVTSKSNIYQVPEVPLLLKDWHLGPKRKACQNSMINLKQQPPKSLPL